MFKRIILTGVGISFCMNVSAVESVEIEDLPLVWSKIITVSGGPSWGTAGQNQYLYPLPPPAYNYYTHNAKTSTLANGEIFFGLQRMINPILTGELGLGVAGTSNAIVEGFINVNGTPAAYAYQYQVNHVRIELKGKLIATFSPLVQPYVSGSFGAGWNHSHDFISTPSNPVLFPQFWLATATTVAFPYTLGAGIQTKFTPNWQVGIGYEFADLGKSFLGGDGVNLTKGARLTHLFTNELLFSVSYLFST